MRKKRYSQCSPKVLIYIENLVYAVYSVIKEKKYGIFMPMDKEYVNTSDIIKQISVCRDRKIFFIPIVGKLAALIPLSIFKKVFCDLYYDKDIAMLCDHIDFETAINESVTEDKQ